MFSFYPLNRHIIVNPQLDPRGSLLLPLNLWCHSPLTFRKGVLAQTFTLVNGKAQVTMTKLSKHLERFDVFLQGLI